MRSASPLQAFIKSRAILQWVILALIVLVSIFYVWNLVVTIDSLSQTMSHINDMRCPDFNLVDSDGNPITPNYQPFLDLFVRNVLWTVFFFVLYSLFMWLAIWKFVQKPSHKL